MADSPFRIARAGVAGLLVAWTAATAHGLAGGCLDASVIWVLAGGFSVVAFALGSRQITGAQFVGLLVLAQAIVHIHACCTLAGDQMVVAHLGATAVTAVALRYGEAAVWALAELLGLSFEPVVARALPLVTRLRLLVSSLVRLRSAVLMGGLVSRGPPRDLAFA